MKSCLCILIFLSSIAAHAIDAFQGPLSSSLGGTGRAGLEGAEGVFLNPAQVSLIKHYELDAIYRDGYVDNGQHRQAYAVGAGDNSSEVLFPGALHYIRLRDTGRAQEPVKGELWHVAIGELLASDSLAVGISGYRLSYKMQDFNESTQWNYSLGAIYLINPEFGVAYTLNNLAHPSSKVPQGLREEVQQAAGLYAVVAEIASLRFDISRNEVGNVDKKLVYMAAFESMSGKFVVFRTGYRRDEQRDQRVLSLGLGFNGPRLKFDYAFEKNLQHTSGALHSVDLRLPF